MKRTLKSILSILAAALTLLVPLTGHPAAEEGRKIILWIAVTDHYVYTQAHDRALRKDAMKLVPGHEILTVKANTIASLFRDERVREKLIRQVNDLGLQPGDRITHIFMNSHSGTNPQGTRTTLDHMGRYNEDGPDERLQELLSPIREFTSKDLVVIQNGCFTFCGNPDAVADRAGKFLKYLNAPDGQMYGNMAAESPDPIFPKVGIASTAGVAAALYFAAGHQITPMVVIGTGIAAIAAAAVPASRWAGTKMSGVFNYGKILRFKNGELSTADLVIKKNDLNAIYTRDACAEGLGELSGLLEWEVERHNPK